MTERRRGADGAFVAKDGASRQIVKRQLAAPASPTDPMVELGTTGLRQFGGIIDEEFLPQLRGSRGYKVYREMRDNDTTVGALLFAIEMLIRQVSWRVEAAGESPADVDAKEFLESCLEDMQDTWEDTLASILSFLQFGYSLHEVVFKRRNGSSRDPRQNSRFDDGRIGWKGLPIRSQESIQRWEFDPDNGELLGAWQQAPPRLETVFLPCPKLLHFRTTIGKGNPEGRSILRSAYKAWFRKSRIETIEGIGIERDLAGLPVALVPQELLSVNASPDQVAQREEIARLLRNIRRDEKDGIIFPLAYDEDKNLEWELKLLTTGGKRQFDTTAIVTRYDQRIAMSVLADFLLLGMGRTGSFALAEVKTNLFSLALGSWLDSIADIFNRVAIPQLFAVNAMALDELPKLVHDDVQDVDLAELGAFLTQLAGAGAPLFPDTELENVLREKAGLPSAPEDREEEPPPPSDEEIADLMRRMEERRLQNQPPVPPGDPPVPPGSPPVPPGEPPVPPDDDDDDDD